MPTERVSLCSEYSTMSKPDTRISPFLMLSCPLQDRPNAVVNERRNTSAMRGAVIQRSVPAAGIDHSYYQTASRGAARLSLRLTPLVPVSWQLHVSACRDVWHACRSVYQAMLTVVLSCGAADGEPLKLGGFGPQYGGTSYQERVSRMQVTQLWPLCAVPQAAARLHAKPLDALTVVLLPVFLPAKGYYMCFIMSQS